MFQLIWNTVPTKWEQGVLSKSLVQGLAGGLSNVMLLRFEMLQEAVQTASQTPPFVYFYVSLGKGIVFFEQDHIGKEMAILPTAA